MACAAMALWGALLVAALVSLCAAQPFDFSSCVLGSSGIAIGRTISESGLYQAESLEAANGHDFWLDYQNNVLGGVVINGTRCPFSLETWNDASDPDLVTRLYEDMVTNCNGRNPVDVLFGPYATLLNTPALAVAKAYRVPFIFHGASDPSLFAATPGGTVSFGLLVRASRRSQICMNALTNTTRNPQIRTAALINFNETFQVNSIRNIATQLATNGVQLVYNETVPGDQSDFSATMAQLALLQPDLLVLGLVASNAAPFLTQLRALDYNPQAIYMTNSASLKTVATSLPFQADLVFAGDQWQPKLPYADALFGNASSWASEYERRYSAVPTLFAAAAFAAGLTLADAVTRAQSVDPTQLAIALRATNLSSTFFGAIAFSSSGEASLPAICVQSIADNLEIVSPQNLITEELVYPAIPTEPPKPKDNTAKRNRLIIGLTVGLGLFVIILLVVAVILLRSKYHLVFLSKDVKAEKDTWG